MMHKPFVILRYIYLLFLLKKKKKKKEEQFIYTYIYVYVPSCRKASFKINSPSKIQVKKNKN